MGGGFEEKGVAFLYLWLMNSLGIFNNRGDNADDLKAYLEKHFQLTEFESMSVALFAVRLK